MSNYRERREAGHYEPGASTPAPEPDDTPLIEDEDEDEADTEGKDAHTDK